MEMLDVLEEAIAELADIKHILRSYYQRPDYVPSMEALQLFAAIALHAHNVLWISEVVHSEMQKRCRMRSISLES